MADKKKFVYSFGNGKADGHARMRELLGGKGAGLHEMTRIGIPVPPGFTITTEVCRYYYDHDRRYPKELGARVEAGLGRMEKILGRRFGDRSQSASGFGPFRGARIHAGNDGHGAQFGAQRSNGTGFDRAHAQSALRFRCLQALHSNVCGCGAGHQAARRRGSARSDPRTEKESRAACGSTPISKPRTWKRW